MDPELLGGAGQPNTPFEDDDEDEYKNEVLGRRPPKILT